MEFTIDSAEILTISDQELEGLLMQVYVNGGFTDPEEAAYLFQASAVKKRGIILGARERRESILAGIVIIVPPDSPACRLAKANEAEMHLLAVLPDYRCMGLGRLLVEAAITSSVQCGYEKIILWTQTKMNAAKCLYESMGFIRTKEMSSNGRDFWVYERSLCADKEN